MKIIKLEDQGQDFTELRVDDDNIITETSPFQGWVWKGFRIEQRNIGPGTRLRLTKPGEPTIQLRYPVVAVILARGE